MLEPRHPETQKENKEYTLVIYICCAETASKETMHADFVSRMVRVKILLKAG